ncbi:MAG: SEC-C metal-binding domain-containing protein [Bryobacteraceae bacterium]
MPLATAARNAPCPCGSKLKFKRCCGINAPPVLHATAP